MIHEDEPSELLQQVYLVRYLWDDLEPFLDRDPVSPFLIPGFELLDETPQVHLYMMVYPLDHIEGINDGDGI